MYSYSYSVFAIHCCHATRVADILVKILNTYIFFIIYNPILLLCLFQSFTLYEEVPRRTETDDSDLPPVPPQRNESKETPKIQRSESANELDLVNRNNNRNHGYVSIGQHVDRPLPPLPPTTVHMDSIDEPVTTDEDPDEDDDDEGDEANNDSSNSDSDNERIDEEPSDADSESNDDNTHHAETVPNASHADGVTAPINGGREESFDADATLPPSPTEKSRPNGFVGGGIENEDRYNNRFSTTLCEMRL